MSLDMLLLDSKATVMQASVNVSRLATYMSYLQAGSMYSITSFDSVFDFGLIRGLLSRSRFGLVAEFVNVLRTKTKPCFDVFFLLLGWSMYLHLEVASLDFGKRWQAQGYGQAKLTLMQATTSEYLQHLSKAGSMYSVTGFEEPCIICPLEIIEAGKELYEEKLWVKPWLNFNELQELKLAVDDAPTITPSDLG
ncbi:hypothetical protein F2Q68_00035517 [Brassica cretica]|uniref:Uncharacterized protein n=1 Tax=Brassica cretica TaxID=69181 RepID=A0A8S9GWP8_BRACR|nr:hypothetical protein F2Q68_00035517 [Brassica cretica]